MCVGEMCALCTKGNIVLNRDNLVLKFCHKINFHFLPLASIYYKQGSIDPPISTFMMSEEGGKTFSVFDNINTSSPLLSSYRCQTLTMNSK
jgi:hypothetical protein